MGLFLWGWEEKTKKPDARRNKHRAFFVCIWCLVYKLFQLKLKSLYFYYPI